MIKLLRSLEVRRFNANEMILNELEECHEIIFVQSGRYAVGYEINKLKMFRLQFGERTIIGGFNLCFNQRSFFIYKANTQVTGMAVRKKTFVPLIEEFPIFKNRVMLKFLDHYDWHIRRPLMRKRNKEIRNIMQRDDYQQILKIDNKNSIDES